MAKEVEPRDGPISSRLNQTRRENKRTNRGLADKTSAEIDRNRLQVALLYAKAGLPVVPLHGVRGGLCTCRDEKCDQPGRHPRTKNGIADATTDRSVIEQMWARWPKAKIGSAMGAKAGLCAVVTEGRAGLEQLLKLVRTNTKLPRTVVIRDGKRCIRLFRAGGANLREFGGYLAEGVRILADGDFVVAPSSLDELTGKRRFAAGRAPGEVEIAQAPHWLLTTGTAVATAREPDADGVLTPQQEPPKAPSVILLPTSEIKPERISWIWPGVIACGRLTGLVGHPGLGKSQVAIDVAATVSSGRNWPGGAANGDVGDVIILAAEDDAADTIVPRLIAAGADRTRVHVVKAVKGDDGVERAFDLSVDLDRLEKEHGLGEVRLLVVDPISAYVGTMKGKGINRNHGADGRTVLSRLAAFAAQHNLGVLAVSHLNKTAGARAITRVRGSSEWVAVPRAVFLVTEETGTGRRLFLPLKNNLAPDRIGYAFEIENKVVADGIRTSAVVWSNDPVTISPDEALAAAAKKVTSGAVDFLQQALGDGPMDQTEIVRLGKEAGYTEKALRTAREKLGVTPKKEGFGANGKWVWVLAGGAKVLKLVVDNDKSKKTSSDDKQPLVGGDAGGDDVAQDHDSEGP